MKKSRLNKKFNLLNTARNRTRTGTGLPPKDFKSFASAIPPLGLAKIMSYNKRIILH